MSKVSISTAIRNVLKKLGRDKVLLTDEAKCVYASDVTPFKRLPSAIIFPEDINDVLHTITIASEYNIPVTPRGAGSGMSGGAVSCEDGWVLSFTKMKKIISIDPVDKTVLLEPGVVTSALQDEAAKYSLFYPPDPSSYKFCTIGGNIAENAGGLRCLKYGVTADYILGLEIVDYSANVYHTGILSNEDIPVDLTPLFCGSEGMLGLVTKAALKLIDQPKHLSTALVEFPTAADAANSVTEILNLGILPCIMEFIDRQTLQAIIKHIKLDITPDAKSVLIMEFDDSEDKNTLSIRKVKEICQLNSSLQFKQAETAPERDTLWKLRRSISPSLTRIAPDKINEDIAIPRGRLAEFMLFIENLSEEMSMPIPVYGHAGDGNFHVNFLYDKNNHEEYSHVKKGVVKVFKKVISLGGTITGEHGVGLSKKEYLPFQLTRENIRLHKDIKRFLDKKNLLNPDKMFI